MAKRKTLFDDRPVEISELTYVIKQDLASLNQQISNMRLPLQINPGGKAGSYNADGGDLGRGSGTSYEVAQISPIFFRFAIEITKLVEYATAPRERRYSPPETGPGRTRAATFRRVG